MSEYSISAVLVREEDGQQSPVYYVSKRLHDAKTRYISMEKLVYALILASRKLRPYFQAHRVEVRTAYPLRQVLHKPESSGRMLKWAVELGQFDLEYVPRTAIKGQALADFLLEFDSEIDDKALFYATNNDAEYEALINGLKIALEMGVRNLIVRSDSELLVNQVNGGFQARGPRTELYLRCTQCLIGMFKEVRLECVPREKNSNADALAKMGSQQEAVLLGSIPLEIQEIPSIPEVETMRVDEAPKETWMTPILAYIRKGILPEDKFMARRLCYQAARYVIYDEVLYKRGFNQPLLRFRISYKLVSDNGKQFDSKELQQLCEELKIKKEFAAVYHPQSNGQTEAVGDLVLRKVMPNTKNPRHGVFGANWEGPYRVKSILWKGTYHLEDMEGKLVPRAWNAEHLRKNYQ
ncbi:uncharacterized protein LOC141660733 [Apium graveolens]|uniref:uncharacterized protein LOC141660733 n=1 Tax=Apium graveolens TaxID=4045 RepID=UPI003D7BBF63